MFVRGAADQLVNLLSIPNDHNKLVSFLKDIDEAFEAAKENNDMSKAIRLARLQGAARERLNACQQVNVEDIDGNAGRSQFRFDTLQQTHRIPDNEDIVDGNVVTITRYEACQEWTVSLYIRRHWVHQFRRATTFFQAKDQYMLYVTGARGCGKTCFLWMWACMLMKQHYRVLRIQYQKGKSCGIWVLEDGVVKRLTIPVIVSGKALAVVVDDLLRAQPRQFHVCIFDGMEQDNTECEDVMEVLDGQTNLPHGIISKMVLVTLVPYFVPHGDERCGHTNKSTRMAFDSWQEADYIKAAESTMVDEPVLREMLLGDWTRLTRINSCNGSTCEAAGKDSSGKDCSGSRNTATDESLCELTDTEKIVQAVTLKYDLAGGSAQFMFQWNVDRLLETLNRVLDCIQDWSVFTQTSRVPKDAAVNFLMQRFSRNGKQRSCLLCVAVSRYVLLCAHDNCRTKITRAMDAIATMMNSPLKEWAWELKQRDVIYAALNANDKTRRSLTHAMTTTTVQNEKLTLIPQYEATFDGSAIHVAGAKDRNVASGLVIWCSSPSLLGAGFYFDKTLVTLQFTVSKERNLDDVVSLRRALADQMNAQVDQVVHLRIFEKKHTVESTELKECAVDSMEHGFPVDQAGELERKEQFILLARNTVRSKSLIM